MKKQQTCDTMFSFNKNDSKSKPKKIINTIYIKGMILIPLARYAQNNIMWPSNHNLQMGGLHCVTHKFGFLVCD